MTRYGLDGPRIESRRSLWPSGLRRGSAADRLLGFGVRIPPIPVAERSKASVYSRSLAGVAGSNSAGSMDVCVVCVVQ